MTEKRTPSRTGSRPAAAARRPAPARRDGARQSLSRPRSRVRSPREAERPRRPGRPEWLANSPREVELVFFDLETTGGNPGNADIIEVAAVKYVNGTETARFGSLSCPRMHIPRRVQQITGISNEMVRGAPPSSDVMRLFLDFVGSATLVAHGVLADFSFVEWHAEQLKRPELKNFYLCTHLLVQGFLPDIPDKSLSGVGQYFGHSAEGAHRATADAELTAFVFWKIFEQVEKSGCRDLQTLFKVQGDTRTLKRLGAGFEAFDVEGRVPSTPGVFYLFNRNREMTFLSAAPNMRRALLEASRLGNEREFNKILVSTHDFNFDRSPNFLTALLSEKRTLKRVHLPIDPRKLQRRSEDVVQLLLPPDMMDALSADPSLAPFRLPWRLEGDFESYEEGSGSSDVGVPEGLPGEGFESEVRHAPRLVGVRNLPKFQMQRSPGEGGIVNVGPLLSGVIGWAFSPGASAKEFAAKLSEVVRDLRIEDSTLPLRQRFAQLGGLVATLQGHPEPFVSDRPVSGFARFLSLAGSALGRLGVRSNAARVLELHGLQPLPVEHRLRSGIAVVANGDTRATDVAVVARGQVRRLLHLGLDEGDKLGSPRFFTRVFHPYADEILSECDPLFFSPDVCCDIELFLYWFRLRTEEGDWADFSSLSSLYDPGLIR